MDRTLRTCPQQMAASLVAAVLVFLVLTGCSKRSVAWTDDDLPSLTNAVHRLTEAPIIRIDRVDADRRVAVYTTNGLSFLFERSRFGWEHKAAVAARP